MASHLSLSLVVFTAIVCSLVNPEAAVPSPGKQYNILMLLPVSSRSHRNVFMPLATALTERGHKITMLSNHPPPDQNPRITYIEHGLPHFREDNFNMFEVRNDPSSMFELFKNQLPLIARDLYNIPKVRELYDKRKTFDLVIVDHLFNELVYPFAYEKALITICTASMDPVQSAVLGNLQNPAYVANMLVDFPLPMSMLQRAKNIFFSIVVPMKWRYIDVLPPVQEEIDKHFPELPSVLELERNQSLVLFNSHFSISHTLPLLPNQVSIGGMHCKPGKTLPKEFLDFVSGKEPVVYFSLGSVAKGTTMPQKYQTMFLNVFKKLPYKFLWKFETERKDLPPNVKISKWMPQQDVLAHPNVKMFISHCGLLSTQESLYHATPVLGLPIFGDQDKNANYLQNEGLGKALIWETMTEESIFEAITELITNPSYAAKVSKVSAAFKDQLTTPVDRAVYWTEYVIRHEGAHHLKSPEKDLSWVQVFHLDVLALLHVAMYLVYRMCAAVFGLCCGGRKTSSQSQRSSKKKRE